MCLKVGHASILVRVATRIILALGPVLVQRRLSFLKIDISTEHLDTHARVVRAVSQYERRMIDGGAAAVSKF